MVSSLRYLGAVAGASLAASIPPARCKEHRSSGMEKLRMQQQRSSPQAEDVTHLLNSPPPAFGLTAAAEWTAKNALTALQIRLRLLKLEKSGQSSGDSSDKAKSRKKVVVAGGGWAAASFVRQLDPKQFEVVWISPHPQFSYTPLLPAVCGGSLPVAACTAKLRDLLSIGGDPTARGEYHQALIDTVDIKNQKVTCRTAGIPGGPASAAGSSWQESYDYLVLAVGSDVNTFNIRGVKEYALFLRTAEDAQRIRARLAACLEAAANPSATEEMRQRLLTFVIVGAGPSGVEAAAEIQDFLNTEGKKLYAHISKYFRVLVLEMGAAPLPMYNQKVQEETKKTFKKSGIELMLKTQVIQVSQGGVSVKRSSPPAAPAAGAASAAPAAAGGAQPSVDFIPTDFVLWASGVRPTALATTIAKELALQSRPQRLLVDPSLRVLGTERLFALGDCCTIAPPLLADHAEALFELAVKDTRSGSAGTDWLLANGERLSTLFPQLHPKRNKLNELQPRNNLDLDEFTRLLQEIDKKYMTPAPTAQNARQEGRFLALLFNSYLGPSGPCDEQTQERRAPLPGFVEKWRGSLCFLGNNTAALQLPFGTFVGGFPYTFLWKLVYLQMQPSCRSCWRCCEGWIQSVFFGRDIDCVIPPPSKGSLSES